MSWDISLHTIKPACEHCGRQEERDCVLDVNYTSNMRPMINRAGFDWDQIEGKPAREAKPLIDDVLMKMVHDRAGYEALNPSNGWGDYSGFFGWLCEISTACGKYPDAIVRVSR